MRVVAVLLLVSCGGVGERAASDVQAIVGGQAGGPAFVVAIDAERAGLVHCSGALVAPKTVLTAAHCLDSFPASSLEVVEGATVSSGGRTPVARAVRHPSADLALLELSTSSSTPPVAFHRALTSADLGAVITVAGFGVSASGSGERRTVEGVLIAAGTQLQLSADAGQACSGDSGGPAWIADGGEPLLVGAVSRGDTGCRLGTFLATLDADWVRRTQVTWEGPSCSFDGACAAGCAAHDPDCGCEADGACRSSCVAPGVDPDCDARCGANAVCAFGPCASPDPDCVPDGAPCGSASQCRSGRCAPASSGASPTCFVLPAAGGDDPTAQLPVSCDHAPSLALPWLVMVISAGRCRRRPRGSPTDRRSETSRAEREDR